MKTYSNFLKQICKVFLEFEGEEENFREDNFEDENNIDVIFADKNLEQQF